jgi:hypothetical protein
MMFRTPTPASRAGHGRANIRGLRRLATPARRLALERWWPLLLLWTISTCTLGEVTAAEGGDVLVVEAHLQSGGARQALLLHRSLQGNVVRGEPGATVTLTTPSGGTVSYLESPPAFCAGAVPPEMTDSLTIEATCYATQANDDLLVQPGGAYELDVISARGEHLRGRTTVPGSFQGRRPAIPATSSFPACSLPPRTNLELMWTQSEGAWSYLATIEIIGLREALAGTDIEAPERLDLTGVSISQTDTTLVLPAEFGLFELTNVDPDLLVYLQGGFPPGVTARLRLSAVDRNYVNAIRGGSFHPSGVIRISSVIGDGVGVFASYVPRDLFIVVEQASQLARC